MPAATMLPSKNVTLRFPSSLVNTDAENSSDESYQLLELPPEILKQVQGSKDVFPLTIKGKPNDDAVLCTSDTTFSLRTVNISNSLLVCRAPEDDSNAEAGPSNLNGSNHANGVNGNEGVSRGKGKDTLQVRDICHQVLECAPQAADLERIRTILKPSQWGGLDATGYWEQYGFGDADEDSGLVGSKRKRLRQDGTENGGVKRWTREQMYSVIQASDKEIDAGLKARNVVEVDGYVLLLPSKHLVALLSLILTLLTIHSNSTPTKETTTVSARIQPILKTLSEDHDVPTNLGQAVLELYGNCTEDHWECMISSVVREMGKGLLENLPGRGMPVVDFEGMWKEKLGDDWADWVNVKLLQGNYLLSPPSVSAGIHTGPIITYFPAHTLPLNPATRFADLFLTKSRWTPEEMAPFLSGLIREGDTKARDKLVTKFVRVVKDKVGVWWYPRRT